MEDQRVAGVVVVGVAQGVEAKQHQHVVAGLDLTLDGAVELREAVGQEHRPVVVHDVLDPGEPRLRRTGQPAADRAVVAREHGDAEVGRPPQVRPGTEMSLDSVQKWVLSGITVILVMALAGGASLIGVVAEPDRLDARVGANVIAGLIGMAGVAAAVANAVHNATGKRVRELPITLDELL